MRAVVSVVDQMTLSEQTFNFLRREPLPRLHRGLARHHVQRRVEQVPPARFLTGGIEVGREIAQYLRVIGLLPSSQDTG